jgi:hypothetical protein
MFCNCLSWLPKQLAHQLDTPPTSMRDGGARATLGHGATPMSEHQWDEVQAGGWVVAARE